MTERKCPHCGKPKAAVYARISDDQKGERLGVKDQIEDCWVRVSTEDWCTCDPDADTYQDNDIGASKGKFRPDWERCLDAIRDGKYQILVARDDGRFTRRMVEFLPLIDLITEQRMQVVTLWTDRWDLSTAQGRKRVRDSASDAQYEAERLGERMSRARLREAKTGRPHKCGRRPYGFLEDRKTHHPTEAPALRDIAARLLAGEALRSAAKRHGWMAKDVRRALLSQRMVGVRRHKGVDYEGQWEPILDRDTWESVGALLRQRADNRERVSGVVARKYLLTGFLFCGVCGGRLQGCLAKDLLRYSCQKGGCTARSMSKLDEYMRDWLLERATDLRVGPKAIDPALTAAVTGLFARLQELDREWEPSGLPVAVYASQRASLEDRLLKARDAVAAAMEQSGGWKGSTLHGPPTPGTFGQVLDEHSRMGERLNWWDDADILQKRTLMERYVKGIVVLKTVKGVEYKNSLWIVKQEPQVDDETGEAA